MPRAGSLNGSIQSFMSSIDTNRTFGRAASTGLAGRMPMPSISAQIRRGLTPAHSSTSDSVAIPNARRQFLQAYPVHEQGRMLLLRSRFPERLLFAIVRNRKGRCRNTLRVVHVEQIGSRLLHSRSRPPCGAPSTTSGRGNRGYPIADWCTGERLVALCLDVEGKRAPVGIEVHAFAVACCGSG